MLKINKPLLTLAMLCLSIFAARGQTLFNDTERQALGSTISSYLERTVDSLITITDDVHARFFASKKNFNLFVNGNKTSNLRVVLKEFMARKSNKYQFYLQKTDKTISCTWEFDGKREYRIVAGISREAVEGTDKEEADKLVFNQIKALKSTDYTMPLPLVSELKHKSNTSLFELTRGNFSVESINGCTYYRIVQNKAVPAFDKLFPVESLHNLALNALPQNNYKLQLTQTIYTSQSDPIQVSLKDFIAYWQQQDCFNCYCGVSADEQGNYDVVCVFEHKELQYTHMLKFRFDSIMFDNHSAVMKASFTTNIPQHNLKSEP